MFLFLNDMVLFVECLLVSGYKWFIGKFCFFNSLIMVWFIRFVVLSIVMLNVCDIMFYVFNIKIIKLDLCESLIW